MKLSKPKFWTKKNSFLSILLLPLSFIFILLVEIRRKITTAKSFKIPVICIGNIFIGGTGKTPTSIFLAHELSKLGKKPVILRKYYSNHVDEYNLIKNNFKNFFTCKSRLDGMNDAIKSGFDVAVLDDGFQDYRIEKNLNILCFNQNQLIGNGLVLPAGPLRERMSALKNVKVVLINGKKDQEFEEKILNINSKLNIFYSTYKPVNLKQFKNKKLLAIAGIGNPDNFFDLLEKNELTVEKKINFPDHYKFSKNEIQKIVNVAQKRDLQIVMTEKDYYKINEYNLENIYYLKVSLEIQEKKKFMNIITSLI
tara:strand:+ start:136 stop:1065 length:930 start_codon:yes stop_codon:yes gene_type:complete